MSLALVSGLPIAFIGCQWVLAPRVVVSIHRVDSAAVSNLKITVCGSEVHMSPDKSGYSYHGRIRCGEGEVDVDRLDSAGAVVEHKLCYVDIAANVRVDIIATTSKVLVACKPG